MIPFFTPFQQTLAEIPSEKSILSSHRGKALREVLEFLKKNRS